MLTLFDCCKKKKVEVSTSIIKVTPLDLRFAQVELYRYNSPVPSVVNNGPDTESSEIDMREKALRAYR